MFYCFNQNTQMKKLYFLISLLIVLTSFSQKDYSRYYNSWRLGLNLGGAWQTADYRSCWGMAGGITLEKGFHENATNIFSFAIRGRYLGANTYGMDYNRNYDVKSNDAYNGMYDPKVNYVDSVSPSRQYVFDNYKMKLGEGSLELQITFNRLRERTHVLLNLWGGIGFTSYRTKSDLVGADGKLYDFHNIDSTGNKTKALNSYNAIIDKKYESFAYGSKGGDVYTFSPSLGIGLGYQFSPGFSMLWEYKVTFPQGTNADLLDGKLGANGDFFGSNDYYHYTGLNLVFTLRGKKKTTKPTTEPIATNTVVPTQTVVAPTNSITPPPTNTVVTNTSPPVTEAKPLISFITPPVNGHVVTVAPYKISAQILNVSSVNQIQFKFNGVAYSNFSFNSQTHILEYNSTLNNGSNSIQIIATNNGGQDNKSTSVVYDQPNATVNPPIITYINPAQAGLVSSTQNYTVKAQVLNVTAQKQISVTHNGIAMPFNYNPTTKQVEFETSLNAGTNTVSINASNIGGSDTKSTTVIYNEPKVVVNPPVISYIKPAQPGVVVATQTYVVKAQVLNVTAQNQISVYYNGVPTVFSYSATTNQVAFLANLNAGSNSVSITANNVGGVDTKTTIVIYRQLKPAPVPPLVTITNPVNAATTSNLNYNFKATVANLPTSAGLVVKFNGVIVANYTYDGFNVNYNAVLVQGNNTFEVTATNNDGTDTKTANVTYKIKAIPVLPVVNLINPALEANATDVANYNFKLSVLNVASIANIDVLFNGVAQNNFTYDINTKELVFFAGLVAGNNTLNVKGTNQVGSDSKQITVEYTPHVELKIPPTITYIAPANGTANSSGTNYNYKATITNMVNVNGITAKYNGMAITNFTYDGFNFGYSATLNIGENTLEISAVNQDGSDVKTAIVNYKPRVIAKPPVVTILQPTGTPTVATMLYNFSFKATNVTQNQVQVLLNGNAITQFTFVNNVGNFAANLKNGNNTLLVKAINTDGISSKTENIFYKAPALPNDTTVNVGSTSTSTASTGSNSTQTVVVCHVSKDGEPVTRTIPVSLLSLHLSHGDTQGACPVKTDSLQVTSPSENTNTPPDKSNNNSGGTQDTTEKKQIIIPPRRPR